MLLVSDTDRPVSPRLRFEVLRRDSFCCRYCGLHAADGRGLTVDHVLPRALGGADTAENLVAACSDCNEGKASVPLDAPLVADVDHDARRWAEAMRRAAEIQQNAQAILTERVRSFDELWLRWTYTDTAQPVERPATWVQTIDGYLASGIEYGVFVRAVDLAMNKQGLKGPYGAFRYFCGVVRNVQKERVQIAADLLRNECDAAVQLNEPDAAPAIFELRRPGLVLLRSGEGTRVLQPREGMLGGAAWGYGGSGPLTAASAMLQIVYADLGPARLHDLVGDLWDLPAEYDDDPDAVLEHWERPLHGLELMLVDALISGLETSENWALPLDSLREWTEWMLACHCALRLPVGAPPYAADGEPDRDLRAAAVRLTAE